MNRNEESRKTLSTWLEREKMLIEQQQRRANCCNYLKLKCAKKMQQQRAVENKTQYGN